ARAPQYDAPMTFQLGGDLSVHRLGFGAMRITGKGVWGPPSDEAAALAWLLEHSPVLLPIPGTASVEHLEENMAARKIRLSDEDVAAIG
ncbi:MAG TPA: aldo/keto reductase, partial [Gemmatimonadaceae bacterium]|nr:aldo/keto reductase [Gemmatimonadaceae bacterium]